MHGQDSWSRPLFTYYTDLRTSSLCRTLKTETSNQQTWSTNQVQPEVETMQARAVDRSAKSFSIVPSQPVVPKNLFHPLCWFVSPGVVVRFAALWFVFRRALWFLSPGTVVCFSLGTVVPFAGYCGSFRWALWFLSPGTMVRFTGHSRTFANNIR